MRPMRLWLPSALIAGFILLLPGTAPGHPHVMDVAQRVEIAPSDLLDDLRRSQVVFVGEMHDHAGHHAAQLSIIAALDDDDRPLAIGLEMFIQDHQPTLDRWTAGELTESEFLPIYHENWSMWPLYRDIFLHARSEGVKLVGLNLPRSVTGKVARNGFKSLPEGVRQMLGDVQCEVDPTYGNYIRRAMGGHGGHGDRFLYFCEAQLLWDSMMARNLVAFLQENPDYRVVVLAGSAHAWNFGIPRQMLELADISYRVVLPEVVGRIDRVSVTSEFADYLWLDAGDDGWSF